jgi:hypothetical protein
MIVAGDAARARTSPICVQHKSYDKTAGVARPRLVVDINFGCDGHQGRPICAERQGDSHRARTRMTAPDRAFIPLEAKGALISVRCAVERPRPGKAQVERLRRNGSVVPRA